MTNYNQKINQSLGSFIILLLVFTLGPSCQTKNGISTANTILSVTLEKNSLHLSELFSSIRCMPLESKSMLAANSKVFYTDNLTFIRSENSIKVFDSTGMLIKSIDRTGRGKGEYTAITDFYINEDLKRIEILDKRLKKLLFYDYEGVYIGEYPLNFWAIKFIRDKQNRLYTYSGNERDSDNSYKFNVYDGSKHFQYHEVDKQMSKYLHVSAPTVFHKSIGNGIIFCEPFNDTIYSLSNSTAYPKYTISYAGLNIPKSFYEENKFSNVFEFFQKFNTTGYVNSTYNAIETDNHLLFYCLKGGEKYLIVYDKQSKTTRAYSKIIDDIFSSGAELPFQNEEFLLFPNDNKATFLIHPSWFLENRKHFTSNTMITMFKNLKEDDNPVLFAGELK